MLRLRPLASRTRAVATFLLLGGLPSALAAAPRQEISLRNEHLRFDFELSGGQFAFKRLVKRTGGGHVFTNDTPPSRLWEVGLRPLPILQGAGIWPVIEKVYPSDCLGHATHQIARSGNGVTLTVRWTDCRPLPADPGNSFDIELIIELEAGNPVSRWNLEIENHLPSWALYYASLLHGFAQEPQDTYLVYPSTGRRIRNPHSSLAPNPTGSPYYNLPFANWQNLQLLPYYTADGHGVYYATHDGKATYAKFTNLFGYGNRYEVQSAYFVENSSVSTNGSVYLTPYPIAVGVFDGNWYDAAQIYRSWAETQPILSKGKLIARTDVPQWFKDLTVVNVGDLPDYTLPIDAPFIAGYVDKWVDIKNYQGLQNDDYFIFHSKWYAPDSLGYYTPRPGIAALFQAFASQGIYNGVHDRAFAYSNTAPPSPCGSPFANSATLVNGSLDPFDPSGYHINPFTPFALCYIGDFVLNRLLGTFAVNKFSDNPYFYDVSYDPAHGNPLGHGGSWIYDSILALTEQVRTAARTIEPKFVVTHEASFEGYLRAHDATGSAYNFSPNQFVNPANGLDETRIPLQATVYHDYSILSAANEVPDYLNTAGVYTNFEDINFVLAYGFNEGRQITDTQPFIEIGLANHELLDPGSPVATTTWAPTIVEYTLFLNALIAVKKTAYGKKYLTYGRLLRPLALAGVPQSTRMFNPILLGVGSPFQITSPNVLSSVWGANDGSGDVGIVLTNFTESPISFPLAFDSATYGLDPTATHSLSRLEPTGSIFLQPFTSAFSIPVSIGPRSVLVYEID